MRKFFCLAIILLSVEILSAQEIKILTNSTNASLRGLSVVDNKTLWVSGSNGTVGKSIDGGATWKWMTVKGFENTDFRDIEAFSVNKAIIMGTGAPSYILRTIDGGENWQVVYEDKTKGMFLDAMTFWNEQSGIVLGDPVNNRFFIGRTFDGGKTWQTIPEANKPVAEKGEYCFASSGTNIGKLSKGEAVFVTGGLVSRIYIRDKKIVLPIVHGKGSTGANSIAVKNRKTMIVVGGDFTKKNDSAKNCSITYNGGSDWVLPDKSPLGYRSCIEYLQKNKWITCGLTGVDMSNDDGNTWVSISKEGFHVCRKAKKGNVVYLAGNDGKVGKLIE